MSLGTVPQSRLPSPELAMWVVSGQFGGVKGVSVRFPRSYSRRKPNRCGPRRWQPITYGRGAASPALVALILDTGRLYATLDRDDAAYRSCRRLLEEAGELVAVPSPVLVEVDYWIHRRLHPGILVALLDDIDAGAHRVEDLRLEDYRRVREICDQCADADVGFVDAAVLAIIERLGEPKLATLDRRRFGLLRPRHVRALQLLPEAL